MINVPIECDPLLTPDFIAHTLDLGMLHYTLGMRAFYLSVWSPCGFSGRCGCFWAAWS